MIRSIWLSMAVTVSLAAGASFSRAQEFKVEEVASISRIPVAQLKSNTIIFDDHRRDELVDPNTGLIRFEDWARAETAQKQYLSLFPSYVEAIKNRTVDGLKSTYTEKLSMYVLEARFVLAKSLTPSDFSQYVSVPFVEQIDPAIKHSEIAARDVMPVNNPDYAFNQNPKRAWCADSMQVVCIESRYSLEGRLPAAIHLANMLMEGKKHVNVLEFQSELRVVPAAEIDRARLQKLTGLDTAVVNVLEQNIFYVNQVMEFGKFFAVFQQHPTDTSKTIATAYMTIAIKNKVLDRKKEFERIPVLRNLVPGQVLMGKSSFNTGQSLSAGLPSYTRNQIAAVANILARD